MFEFLAAKTPRDEYPEIYITETSTIEATNVCADFILFSPSFHVVAKVVVISFVSAVSLYISVINFPFFLLFNL